MIVQLSAASIRRLASALAGTLSATALAAGAQSAPPQIPLCEGLTIVTAIHERDGDYESIKTIESIDSKTVRIKYSAERRKQDFLDTGPPQLEKVTLHRSVRREDLAHATLYQQQFADILPDTIPRTTSIGTSTAVWRALKGPGSTEFGIFIPYSQASESLDRNVHPNVYDNQMVAEIRRVERTPVMLPVLVDDSPEQLPALHAAGNFFGDETELYFLDDPDNPITLEYRFGTRPSSHDSAGAAASGPTEKDRLQVTKISRRCKAPGPSEGAEAAALERSLAAGRAEIYDIYFSFNSDQIREESEPSLNAIALVLGRHPEWRLRVTGHTDNIGGDPYNLTLSKNRAAAVRSALIARYHINASRLTADGLGASSPQDTNDTLEGRARNRRVELIRQ